MIYDLIVLGAGAAGIFAAINTKLLNKNKKVLVLERYGKVLSKVKISGGGRCNVTTSCWDLKQLVMNYPRGHRELLGPFHMFGPKDTFQWFKQRGILLKTEADGRMFPITDSSTTIIECLLEQANALDISIVTNTKILGIDRKEELFTIHTKKETLKAKRVLLATGSHSSGYDIAKSFGHIINDTIPSLFTFNIPNFSYAHLSGIGLNATIKLSSSKLFQSGPVLITHFGLSGPATLKLSAFAAKEFFERKYETTIYVNWTNDLTQQECFSLLKQAKDQYPQKLLSAIHPFALPKKLYRHFCVPFENKLCNVSLSSLRKLCETLTNNPLHINGKTTNKEEFVTCGGIHLKEVNFKTMESKKCKNLFFAGEILDIDGVTGGFNFQNAWTNGYIAAKAIAL